MLKQFLSIVKVCVPHCPTETYSPWGSFKSQQNENAIKDRSYMNNELLTQICKLLLFSVLITRFSRDFFNVIIEYNYTYILIFVYFDF